MEEPQRGKILDSFKVFCDQFDQSVLRARADLQSGLPLEDLIAGGGAEFAKGSTQESLAFAVICLILREARKPVRAARKKTAVPAKRSKVARVKEVGDDAV